MRTIVVKDEAFYPIPGQGQRPSTGSGHGVSPTTGSGQGFTWQEKSAIMNKRRKKPKRLKKLKRPLKPIKFLSLSILES